MNRILNKKSLKSACKVALVVGPLIVLVNQWDMILSNSIDWLKVILSFLIPFCVSTVSMAIATAKPKEKSIDTDTINNALVTLQPIISRLEQNSKQVFNNACNVNKRSKDRSAYADEVLRNTEHNVEASQLIYEHIKESPEHLTMISESFKKAHTSMRQHLEQIEENMRSTAKVITTVEEFAAEFEKITNMTSSIRSISEQTNLLALNAAIEAARAGEQGRGFAVVADEVKALASQSGKTAEQITKLMNNLSNSMEGLSERTKALGTANRHHNATEEEENSADSAKRVQTALEQTKSTTIEIAEHSQQQVKDLNHIMQNVAEMAESSKDTIKGSAANMKIGENLIGCIDELKTAINTINNSVQKP